MGDKLEHAPTNVLKTVGDVPIDNVFFLHCLCHDCTNVPSYFNSTSYHTLSFGKGLPIGWTFSCENTYSALPA